MPFSSPLSEHVHVVPTNATCNGHRAVVGRQAPSDVPQVPQVPSNLVSFLQSPATTSCSLPHPDSRPTSGLAHNRSPSAIAKRDGLFPWGKRAYFTDGRFPIKITENAATFQPPLPPERSVASVSSAFDQQAHGCWQCGPKVRKTGHANL